MGLLQEGHSDFGVVGFAQFCGLFLSGTVADSTFLITSTNHRADVVNPILCMVRLKVSPDTSFNSLTCVVFKGQLRGHHKMNIPRISG